MKVASQTDLIYSLIYGVMGCVRDVISPPESM
jgi:hypothetical protein